MRSILILTEIFIIAIMGLVGASMYSILARDPHDLGHILGVSVYITDFNHLSLMAQIDVVVLGFMIAALFTVFFGTSSMILRQIKSL